MSLLTDTLAAFRASSHTEREKGNYIETRSKATCSMNPFTTTCSTGRFGYGKSGAVEGHCSIAVCLLTMCGITNISVQCHHKITMSAIPLDAYDRVVNGKPALVWWVMERQAVSIDSQRQTAVSSMMQIFGLPRQMGETSYPLKLFLRVITVSIETTKVVRALPHLDIAASINTRIGR